MGMGRIGWQRGARGGSDEVADPWSDVPNADLPHAEVEAVSEGGIAVAEREAPRARPYPNGGTQYHPKR